MAYQVYVRNDLNLAVDATLTASSANANYPVANVIALPISKPWRTTGDTSESLLMNLGSAKAFDLVAIVGHNLTSAATITFSAGTTDACSDYSTPITWREKTAFKLLSATQTYQYAKITIADAANTYTWLQIGYVVLGAKVSPLWNFAYGWQYAAEYENLETESEYGAPHVYELFNRTRLTLEYQNISRAHMAELTALVHALRRNVTPLFLVPDSAVNDGYFGRFISNALVSVPYSRSTALEFLEDSVGKIVA